MACDCAESGAHVMCIQRATDGEISRSCQHAATAISKAAYWTCKYGKIKNATLYCLCFRRRNVMSGAGNARVSVRHWIERRDIDSVFKQTLTLRVRGARSFPPSGSCRTTGGSVFPAVCFLRHLWANELKLQQSSSRAAGCSLSSSDVTQIPGKLKAVVLFFSLVE